MPPLSVRCNKRGYLSAAHGQTSWTELGVHHTVSQPNPTWTGPWQRAAWTQTSDVNQIEGLIREELFHSWMASSLLLTFSD